MTGRPLRFLAAILLGWVAVRVAWLWPTIETVPDLLRAVAPPLAAAERPERPQPGAARLRIAVPPPVRLPRPPAASERRAAQATLAAPVSGRPGIAAVAPVAPGVATAAPPASQEALLVQPLAAAPAGGSRWSASGWLLARGGADGTLTGGRLGASQAGARLAYALDSERRLAVAVRVATPLAGRGKEVAVGVDWRPVAAVPVRLIAEHRFALDGGRGGPTLMAVGGVGPVPVAGAVRLESYAQGGGIVRAGRVEGFVDGAARVTHPVTALGPARLDLGVGAWGAAQRDAARADLGPTLGVAIPAGGATVRINADWRQRVAGRARPGSGPALSIGADF